MKENILDVLMYLFENYMEYDCNINRSQDELIAELQEQGFTLTEIHKAFHWLEGLTLAKVVLSGQAQKATALRVFTEEEKLKLGSAGIGFLHFLSQIGVLNTATRELVIDRAMALANEEIDLPRLKWVVLMILFNIPGLEAELAWMEDFVLDENKSGLH